jgi:gamma-polyglutamate biosynthesis protein CapA
MHPGSAAVGGVPAPHPRLFLFRLIVFFCLLSLVPTACQPGEPTVILALLGDLVLGRGVDPQVDSLDFLAPSLTTADLALANLESPLTADLPPADSAYNLCAPSDRAGLLTTWGIDLLSLANNHNLDCSADGLTLTRSALEAVGLTAIPPGMEPVYRQVNKLPLAFFAFDDVSSPVDGDAAAEAIRHARQAGAVVVISIHWGLEYQAGVSNRQEELAELFANAGAALILGHHPHVLQPARWFENEGGKTLVLFSLGNALFDQGGLADTRQSALVLVTLTAEGVKSIRSVPFEIDVFNSKVVQPDEETREGILKRLDLPQ